MFKIINNLFIDKNNLTNPSAECILYGNYSPIKGKAIVVLINVIIDVCAINNIYIIIQLNGTAFV